MGKLNSSLELALKEQGTKRHLGDPDTSLGTQCTICISGIQHNSGNIVNILFQQQVEKLGLYKTQNS